MSSAPEETGIRALAEKALGKRGPWCGYCGEAFSTREPKLAEFVLSVLDDVLSCLGRNLAIGGALAAAHDLAQDPPSRRTVVAVTPSGVECVTIEDWAPGCQWPAVRSLDGTWVDGEARAPDAP